MSVLVAQSADWINEALLRLCADVLGVTLFAVLVAAVLYVAFRLRRKRRRRASFARQICPACGYDCRATPDRCPECGRMANPDEGLQRPSPQADGAG
jgi:hypothetical protein